MSEKRTYEDLPPEEFKKTVMQMVEWFGNRRIDKDDFDLRDHASSAATMFLCREAVDMNSDFYRITLGEYSRDGEDQGDWEVTVRHLTPRLKIWREIQSWPKRFWVWLTYKKVYGSSEDILAMENLNCLTIRVVQRKKD